MTDIEIGAYMRQAEKEERMNNQYPKCVRCGEPNTTEQALGECVVCYDCAEELAD